MTSYIIIAVWYMVCGVLLSCTTIRNVIDGKSPRRSIDDFDFAITVLFFGLLWPVGVAVMLLCRRQLKRRKADK